MANEVTIVVTSKDRTDFAAIGARARASMRKPLEDGLKDTEKTTTSRFSEIGDASGRNFASKLDEHLKVWGEHFGDKISGPVKASVAHVTDEIDVKVKTKFKEVGRHGGMAMGDGLKGALGEVEQVGATAGGDLGNSMAKSAAASSSGVAGAIIPVLIATLLPLLPAVGAMAATALVFAFGAGLAGLGLMAAFHLKSVQKEFKSFQKFLHGFMNDIGKPFEQTWATIFNVAGNVLKQFQPLLKGAFKDFVAPAVSRFVIHLGEAFSRLGPAIRPVAKAFSDLLDALGPSLPGIFKGIADAITGMADTISKNPKLFAGFISGLLKLVEYGLKAVGFLAKLFGAFSRFEHSSNPFKLMLAALSPVLAILMHLGVAGKVFHAIGDAAKTIGPKIGDLFDKIKKVAGPILHDIGDQIKNDLVPAFADFMHAAAPLAGLLIKVFSPVVVASIKNVLHFVSGLLDVLSGVLKIAGGLLSGDWSKMWDGMKETAKGGARIIKTALDSLLDGLTLGHGDKVIKVTLSAVNRVSGPVKAAIKTAKGFAHGIYKALLTAHETATAVVHIAEAVARRFARATYRAALTAHNAVHGAVNAAISACSRFARRAYRASLTALNKVGQALRDAINMGNDWARRVFTATFNVIKSIIPGMAHGGIVGGMAAGGIGHAAEGGPRSNLTLVGEQGAELVRLPTGSQVYPHGQSMGMLGGGGGGAVKVQLEWVGGNAGDSFMIWLKNNIRIRAGGGTDSVQRALGG